MLKNKNKAVLFIIALGLGFLLRVYFISFWTQINGDLLLYMDWGERFWELGARQFYFENKWYYAPPNYPPIISLLYASAYWLFERRYVLAQIHNAIKIIPAAFIIYFGEHGYEMLLKLPSILADLALSILVYKVVFNITKNSKKALCGFLLYLFNPITIFLSSVWGQTDSLIAVFSILSFILLINKKYWLSIPLLFISLYIKPNWSIFLPLYLYLLIVTRPKLNQLFAGGLISSILFIVTTYPFGGRDVLGFLIWLLKTRIIPTATVAQRVSVSAFNFQTIFFVIDKDLAYRPVFGIPANVIGWGLFLLIYVLTLNFLKKKKDLTTVFFAIFTIGFAGFLFLPNMLERYFFPILVPLIILIFSRPKLLIWGLLINLAGLANLIWAFFRRKYGEINDLFINNNYLLIKIISLINFTSWFVIVKRTKFLKER